MRGWGLGLLLSVGLINIVEAATFTEVEATRHGDWRSVLYRNDSDSRLFCAFESIAEKPVLRINSYLADGDTFLEIFDPEWTKLEGVARFSLKFDVPDRGELEMEMKGQSWGDSYTYDILETETFGTMQAFFGMGRSVEVENSNGATLAEFRLKGSAAALRAFNACREQG
jgi:hypothetical protein